MTIIHMLETRRGSPDGHMVERYHEGRYYDVPHTLAAHFVNQNWAIALPEEDIGDGLNQINARNVERKMQVANLSSAINLGMRL